MHSYLVCELVGHPVLVPKLTEHVTQIGFDVGSVYCSQPNTKGYCSVGKNEEKRHKFWAFLVEWKEKLVLKDFFVCLYCLSTIRSDRSGFTK